MTPSGGARGRARAALVHAIVAAVPALFVFLVRALGRPNYYDDGLLASGALMLDGLLPYRDFWLPYGPLAPALAAIPFALFGPHHWVLPMLGAVLSVAIAVVAVGFVPARAGIVRAALLVGLPLLLSITAYHIAAFALLAALVAIRLAWTTGPRTDVWCGVALALTALLRPDFGVYAAVAVLVVRPDVRVVAGAAALAAPVAALLLVTVPLPHLVEQLLAFPLLVQTQHRSIPLSTILERDTASEAALAGMLHFGPPIALVATVVAALRQRTLGRREAALVAFAIVALVQGFQRADPAHAAQAAVPVVVAIGAIVPTLRMPGFARARDLAVAALIVVVALASTRFAVAYTRFFPEEARTVARLATVLGRIDPEATLFIGLPDNTRTPVNATYLYIELRRLPASRYTSFNPGVTDTDEVQQRIVDELQARPRSLVLLTPVPGWDPDGSPTRGPGSEVLDAFLADAYETIHRDGAVSVLARRGR